MISKQDFLDMVQNQIFPILQFHQKEIKWLKILSFKRLLLFLFLSSGIFTCISFIVFGVILKDDGFYAFISVLLGIFIPILIFIYLIRFANKISNKIGKIIMPKIFSVLNLENHPITNNEYNLLDNLSRYGFLPDFDTPFIWNSLILKESYYGLLVQYIVLSLDTNKRSKSVFSGLLVSSKKICLPNSSLLILAKQLKHNLTQKELTKKYPTKSLEKGNHWKFIDYKGSQLGDEYAIYGINIRNSDQILSPEFIEGLKKIKSLYSACNILIDKNGIFIATETEYPFAITDIDLKPYGVLYDTC